MELSLTAFTDKTGAVTGVLVKGKHSGLYQINAKAVVLATGGVAYEIFDQKVRDKVKQTGAAFELGLAKEGNTIRELAAAAGIDPDNLQKNNDRLQPLC